MGKRHGKSVAVIETLSLPAARRIALAAQGFGGPRPVGPLNWGHLRRVLDRTRLLQIDSVNVLARAHYLPVFSRLGAYPRELLETAAWDRPRRLFEFWGHEASLLPLDMQPLFRWRMAEAEQGIGVWGRLRPFAAERRHEADRLLATIAKRGGVSAGDLEPRQGGAGWWGWSDAKAGLEWLFWSGKITTRTRRGTFERVYDLTERVLPKAILDLPTPDPAEAHRVLLRMAAESLGVATAADLRDYFRLRPDPADRCLADLVAAGDLVPVAVEGWRQPAYLHPGARRPRRIHARALLAPFDPLIWERSRVERLFGVRYRIEIYTPADKRVHGYYVLPFLLGDALVARVDLKADRQAGVLRVQNAHAEPHAPFDVARQLAEELALMAGWLGLPAVVVEEGGDLAPALRLAVAGTTATELPKPAHGDEGSDKHN